MSPRSAFMLTRTFTEKYALLPHGASIGDNYGPIVVSREAATPDDIPNLKIAIPGKLTSAFLALRIFNSDFKYEVVPFDKIIDAVQDGTCDAGLLIHEGQLFYESKGLHKVLDLGEWWHQQHGLPLPMGGNAIRRDLGRRPDQGGFETAAREYQLFAHAP